MPLDIRQSFPTAISSICTVVSRQPPEIVTEQRASKNALRQTGGGWRIGTYRSPGMTLWIDGSEVPRGEAYCTTVYITYSVKYVNVEAVRASLVSALFQMRNR